MPIHSNKIGSTSETLVTFLPVDGAHAVNTADWFHVAVTYNGDAATPANTRFYWTRLASGAAQANEIGAGVLTSEFDSATMQGDFSIGNEARSFGGSTEVFIGSIDEVRISSIARAPTAFLFAYDTDTDSLPDAWEMLHFGDLASGPNDDSDGDGTSNRTEFLIGLDPADGSSAFRSTIRPTGSSFTLTWPNAPGLRFRVERSTTLAAPWDDLGTVQTGTFTDSNPPPERAFYRVILLVP